MFDRTENSFSFSNGGKTINLFGDSATVGDEVIHDGDVTAGTKELCDAITRTVQGDTAKHGSNILSDPNFTVHVGSMTACAMWASSMITMNMIANMTGNRMENVQVALPTGVVNLNFTFRDNDNGLDGVGCFLNGEMLF